MNYDKRLKDLRRKINTRLNRSIEQQLSENSSYTHLTTDELLFAHTMSHFIYSRGKRSSWKRDKLFDCHERLINEMSSRDMKHFVVDKMDRYYEQKLEGKSGEEWEWSKSYID